LRSSQSQSSKGRQHLGALPHFSRRTKLIVVIALSLAIISITPQLHYSLTLAQGTSPTSSATIIDYAFQPQHINVTTGTQVTWTYASSGKTVHTVTSTPQTNTTQGGTPLINSGAINPGQSFAYTFYAHGFYPIQCSLHPNIAAMNGWVNVTGSDIQPPSQSPPPNPVNYVQYAIIGAIVGIAIIISIVAYSRLRIRRKNEVPGNPTTSDLKG
jgi:plastocyanin